MPVRHLMNDDETRAVERWENEGGRSSGRARYRESMRSRIQRAAATWLLPVTVVVLSPLIIRKAWKRWRRPVVSVGDGADVFNEEKIASQHGRQ